MRSEIQNLKRGIAYERQRQWSSTKKILMSQQKERAKQREDLKIEFGAASTGVNHPFTHIAANGTVYDFRKKFYHTEPQHIYSFDPNPFHKKEDPIKAYNESMYKLGCFAPPRRKDVVIDPTKI